MYKDIEKILVSEEEIKKRVAEIGERIEEDYKDKNLLLLGILKGSVVFLADLMRNIKLPLSLDFVGVSSYGDGSVSSGNMKVSLPLSKKYDDYDVIIIEDILDSGNTVRFLTEMLAETGVKSVKVCALFSKPSRRKNAILADYEGFVVPDEFIVGYGLDYAQKYRNLPFVGVLKRSVYEK